MARVSYFRAFFHLAFKINFCNNKSVHFLELSYFHGFNLHQNDDPLTQSLCSSGASVEIVASLPFKTSANVIVVVS